MILVAPERAARRADRTPSPGGGRGEGACLDPPAHRMVAQGGRGRTRRGEGHPHCTYSGEGCVHHAVRARDRAARATGSRVTLHQQSPHDSGVRLRALCRLRSAIITELCRLPVVSRSGVAKVESAIESRRDAERPPPPTREPCAVRDGTTHVGRRRHQVLLVRLQIPNTVTRDMSDERRQTRGETVPHQSPPAPA